MKTLTVRVIENPDWLAYRCKLQDEAGDTTLCPFFGAECPLGPKVCREVTAKDWEAVLEEEDEDGNHAHETR